MDELFSFAAFTRDLFIHHHSSSFAIVMALYIYSNIADALCSLRDYRPNDYIICTHKSHTNMHYAIPESTPFATFRNATHYISENNAIWCEL